MNKKAKLAIFSCIIAGVALSGCAGKGEHSGLIHLWREIKGIGVPYGNAGNGKIVLLSNLGSGGCTWLPKGTTLYASKPWPRSGYSAVYAYRTPNTFTKWPCTAEAVDGGLVYFSHAVVPPGKISCTTAAATASGAVESARTSDGKASVRGK